MARSTAAPALAAIALAALALAAPPAAADAPEMWALTVHVAPVDNPLAPGGRATATEVTVSAPCEATLLQRDGILASLSVTSAPPWASANVEPPAVRLRANTCMDGQVTARAEMRVALHRNAPALEAGRVEVVAETPGLREGRHHLDVAAAPVVGLALASPRAQGVGEAGEAVEFPLTVVNRGNVDLRVTLEVREAFEDARVRLPDPFTIPAATRGPASGAHTTTVTVEAPPRHGYTWAHERVVVGATAVSLHEGAGEEASRDVELVVATDGLYVPPVTVALALSAAGAGGAGVAWGWRRFKRSIHEP